MHYPMTSGNPCNGNFQQIAAPRQLNNLFLRKDIVPNILRSYVSPYLLIDLPNLKSTAEKRCLHTPFCADACHPSTGSIYGMPEVAGVERCAQSFATPPPAPP